MLREQVSMAAGPLAQQRLRCTQASSLHTSAQHTSARGFVDRLHVAPAMRLHAYSRDQMRHQDSVWVSVAIGTRALMSSRPYRRGYKHAQ